jgi:hypothetical protein
MHFFHRLASVITVWLTVAATLFAGLPRVTCGCADSSSKPLGQDSSARLSSCSCGGACCSGNALTPRHSCCAQAQSRSTGTVQARTLVKRPDCARMIVQPPTVASCQMQKLNLANAAPVSGLPFQVLSPHLMPELSSSTLQLCSARHAPENLLTLLTHLVI